MEGTDENRPSPSPESPDEISLPLIILLATIYICTTLYNLLKLNAHSQLSMFLLSLFSGKGSRLEL